ncbi:hypothetical protein DdX_15341 [Ditylenchus destructor]|uniref:Saposin B-type domain-containing protein n=1 Tax=Ditylenchus destructor TaxID=166010 RepID=A0AAD4R124_9BILA|nr:hypothetical protein DdX_15341 [Ditylenchus destructor]
MSKFILIVSLVAFSIVGFCSAKSIGFNAIEAHDPCQFCKDIVANMDESLPGELPPGSASEIANFYKSICALGSVLPPSLEAFCKALAGKEQAFGEAYVKHHDQKEGDPCKEVQIC